MIRICNLMVLATALTAVLGSPVHTSSVYLQRGPPPVEYVSYEVPVAAAGGYNIGPTLYANYQPPCVAPCVVEGAAAPQPAGKAKTAEAKAAEPNMVILPGQTVSSPYDYAYVIYNEAAGPQQQIPAEGIVSAQFEYRPYYGQEILYTTDVVNGYNTYFRNYVPQVQSGVGVKAQRGHGGYYVGQHGYTIAHSSGVSSTTLPPTTVSTEKPEPEKEEPKKEVENLKTLEEMEVKEDKEPELLEDSAEMSTEEMPGAEDDLKYILTFEDLIKCTQNNDGSNPHNHKGHNHNHNKPSAEEDKKPEHSGHESSPESPKENKDNSEGAPASGENTSEMEEPKTVSENPTKEISSSKHHKKSPVTYIILPQIAASKPC
ncbi:uncharacterized protein LOC105388422 [Plutella xylostella]|uniref:uncharacterized protein LOC105388422 n=1 Tax=Plutella xylostella TaxID=51655 RepID=UPI0020324285|nr:uncharacterized protein LOC105388422 [Plutella xylostella]